MPRPSSIPPATLKRLAAELQDADGNVAAVARKLDISASAIRRWQQAKARPSAAELLTEGIAKIAEGVRLIERSQRLMESDGKDLRPP